MDKKEKLIEENNEQYRYDKMSTEDKLVNQLAEAISEQIDSEIIRSIGKITWALKKKT